MLRHGFASVALGFALGLLMNSVDTRPVDAAALTVHLPGTKPDEFTSKVKLADIDPSQAASLKLTLLNPDHPHKAGIDRYELEGSAADGKWNVVVVEKTGTKGKVATISLRGGVIEFQWDEQATRRLLSGLRNCSLNAATDAGAQRVHLREPQRVEAAALDFRKDFISIPLKADDVPDEDGLKLEILELAAAPPSASIERGAKDVKEPAFVVLKPTEPDVPGARLRVLLSKNGSAVNVLIRPELTPARPDSFGSTSLPAITQTTPTKTTPTKTIPSKAGSTKTAPRPMTTPRANDPTAKSNEPNLLFTTRKLLESKNIIGGQLTSCKQRIGVVIQQIGVRRNELNQFPTLIVGTPDEIAAARARIAKLQAEIASLSREQQQLERLVPEFEKQLAAFPPLESLGNSMQLKTQLNLRVFYTVDKEPVDLLIVGGAASK